LKKLRALLPVALAVLLGLAWCSKDTALVVERPAKSQSDTVALLITGDGGWTTIDRELTERLNQHGISVVGLNALRYFWWARTPDGTAADVARILRDTLRRWQPRRFVLIGYSRGADVMPFVVNRLPADLRQRVALVALLGLEPEVGFEFHLRDLLADQRRASDLAVAPEAKRLDLARVLCVAGSKEPNSLCPELAAAGAETIVFDGGHHFGERYREIADAIVAAAKAR
jgi:type IV secretory pathway VirJ component